MLPPAYEALVVPASNAPIVSLGVFVLSTDFSMDNEWEGPELLPSELRQLGELAGVGIIYAYPYPKGIVLLSSGNACEPNPRVCALVNASRRYTGGVGTDDSYYFGTAIYLKHKKVAAL